MPVGLLILISHHACLHEGFVFIQVDEAVAVGVPKVTLALQVFAHFVGAEHAVFVNIQAAELHFNPRIGVSVPLAPGSSSHVGVAHHVAIAHARTATARLGAATAGPEGCHPLAKGCGELFQCDPVPGQAVTLGHRLHPALLAGIQRRDHDDVLAAR